MAWIEAHQKLQGDPKTLDLMNFMQWDLDTTIGKLFRFWWWCVDYAEDGDLKKHNDSRIAAAMGVANADAARLVKAMVEACWLDRDPYFRVHDWWDYIGKYLKGKYSKTPEKWERIRELYDSRTDSVRKPSSQTDKQTEQTKPLTPFGEFWAIYPRKTAKTKAESAWAKIAPGKALFERMRTALESQKRSEQWRKDGGQFIPHPATWLNQRRWEDEPPSGPLRQPQADRGAMREIWRQSFLCDCHGRKMKELDFGGGDIRWVCSETNVEQEWARGKTAPPMRLSAKPS